ncbi:substrate-binding periplasmic protein [Paenisporosarcina cavernae]|uniref:ABC transporter substrate-binding protein n=1 Tax=Paenisporosarcina cavernae TaxID=2320858 RepID=A0A385YPT0_9BACL|nr:transporter substrate-binding domain-containing protein [Paenisporosarcina cavernae]AYC28514.1 ABC transporter substrate-binding protein [Paenisporosarcina cavernae]
MKKLALVVALTGSLIGLSACGAATEDDAAASGEKKVLKMGTSADFAPFESMDTSGEIVGFDIDLAKYVADELGYTLDIEDMKFDGLIGALQTKRVDMVLAGMSATDERDKNVDFSTEYHSSGEMFLTVKDSDIQSVEDLEGKTVAVQLGTIQEEGAKKLQEQVDFELKPVDSAMILVQELLANRVDVAYLDQAVGKGFMEEQDLAGFEDTSSSSPGMAIAFPEGSELIDDVDAVLAEMEESGKLQELKDKWLKED